MSYDHTLNHIRQALAAKPDGILESLASEYDVPVQTIVEAIPTGTTTIGGQHFIEVLTDIAAWGAITLICHSKDAIVEFCGPFPLGSTGHGMYNLKGEKIGISGHLKPENCKAIIFVRRPFMGVDTLSVQFFNAEGNTIFKIYVGRDEQRQLKTDQVERFTQLEGRFSICTGQH